MVGNCIAIVQLRFFAHMLEHLTPDTLGEKFRQGCCQQAPKTYKHVFRILQNIPKRRIYLDRTNVPVRDCLPSFFQFYLSIYFMVPLVARAMAQHPTSKSQSIQLQCVYAYYIIYIHIQYIYIYIYTEYMSD